jgi:pSer/pThr/pTyr-binding forkhead associated (FHA) protein
MASLVVLSGDESTRHVLNEGETLIGRHPDCAVEFPSSVISGKHALIVKEGEE